MAQKPSIPKGTRDFSPLEMARRNYIFDTIKSVFSLYGFQQIETPAMENLSTLMGKYGEEGDKLLFKILNSGDWKSAISHEALDTATIGALTTKVSEKGLRYDLTVPFARFVVQHREEIQFPFKRYQIQPVWRADRPQKGRYREFYQCDVDVVGTNSLLSEVELIQIVEEVYRRLGIRVSLHINNRKILAGIAEVIGQPERIIDITVAIDKLDKIGVDNVNKELLEKGLPEEAVNALQPILHLSGTNTEKLDQLEQVLAGCEVGLKGIEELRTIFALYNQSDLSDMSDKSDFSVELDLCLARGLNYYTGAIFEVKALDAQIGSITGGGRYDNLTGIFGMPNVSGVGISFGADRIYDVLSELNLYPENLQSTTQLLFATFGEQELLYALRWAKALRKKGMSVEVYPEPTKMKKQMGYADSKKIPYVAIVGSDEMAEGKVMLKNMLTGEQHLLTLEELINQLQ
ncbi:MAG: histidine--tRNA ligase [Paludibacteraceae bacterium]|nr:histidine--tRNA ligase [Paludibacteraceae bacterium]